MRRRGCQRAVFRTVNWPNRAFERIRIRREKQATFETAAWRDVPQKYNDK
jgi:hypothetical protein